MIARELLPVACWLRLLALVYSGLLGHARLAFRPTRVPSPVGRVEFGSRRPTDRPPPR